LYKLIFQPIQIVPSEQSRPGAGGVNVIEPVIRLDGIVKVYNDDGTFMVWESGKDEAIGKIYVEGKNLIRKVQHMQKGKVYEISASTSRPESMYPYFAVDDRTDNAKEVTHVMGNWLEILHAIYGEPVAITDVLSNISESKYDYKFLMGKVETMKLPKNGKPTVRVTIGDASIGIDAINSEGFDAFLPVLINEDLLNAQGFGNRSFLGIVGQIKINTPPENANANWNDGVGAHVWYPSLVVPIVNLGQKAQPTNTQAKSPRDTLANLGQKAENKGIPAVNFPPMPETPAVPTPEPMPIPISVATAPTAPIPEPLPVPSKPETNGLDTSVCSDFGSPDLGNVGCQDCIKTNNALFIACNKPKK